MLLYDAAIFCCYLGSKVLSISRMQYFIILFYSLPLDFYGRLLCLAPSLKSVPSSKLKKEDTRTGVAANGTLLRFLEEWLTWMFIIVHSVTALLFLGCASQKVAH